MPAPGPALSKLIGRAIASRYQIEAIIGHGGMGTLFKATHLTLDKPVAVKVLHPQLSIDETARTRFEREAQSASRLNHRNCVQVIDYGETGDALSYLVMEYLEGTSLRHTLGEPTRPALALARVGQMLAGLEHAHEEGVVHRDLKPDNVLVTHDSDGEVLKLIDFGIAMVLDDDARQRLTQTGFVLGTPRYMSPEQVRGEAVDGRSDLYAVGLILYEMLAGWPPFQALDVPRMLQKQLQEDPEPLPPELPKSLRRFTLKLLHKDPEHRYATATEALVDLRKLERVVEGVAAAPKRPPTLGIGSASRSGARETGAAGAATVPDGAISSQVNDTGELATQALGSNSLLPGEATEDLAALSNQDLSREPPSASRSAVRHAAAGASQSYAVAEPARAGMTLWITIGLLAGTLVALAAYVLLGQREQAGATASARAASQGQPEAPPATAPTPAPTQATPPAAAPTVAVAIGRPGSEGDIFLAGASEPLGKINQAPVRLAQGEQPVTLTIEFADGTTQEVVVTPSQDRMIMLEDPPMEPRRGKRKQKRKQKPSEQSAEPQPRPPFQKWSSEKSDDDGLANPFGK